MSSVSTGKGSGSARSMALQLISRAVSELLRVAEIGKLKAEFSAFSFVSSWNLGIEMNRVPWIETRIWVISSPN